MADLLPCPFCGSTNIDPRGWASSNSAGPACDDCGGSAGNASDDLVRNIEAWNRRVPPVVDEAGPVAMLRAYAEGRVDHLNQGDCPGNWSHDNRDPECPVCAALEQTAALAQQPGVETTGSTFDSAIAKVRAELERAVAKFPTWPTDPLHASGVVTEESGELAKAVLQAMYEPHKAQPADAQAEAIQTAAMAIRWLASADRHDWKPGPQHAQQPGGDR